VDDLRITSIQRGGRGWEWAHRGKTCTFYRSGG